MKMIREYLEECYDYIICYPFGPAAAMLGCIIGSLSVVVLVLIDLVSRTIVTDVIISSIPTEGLLFILSCVAGVIGYTRTYSFRRL